MTFDAFVQEAIKKAVADEIANIIAVAIRQELAAHNEEFIALARHAVAEMLKAAK